MIAVSVISTMKVDRPRARLSEAPIRVKMRSMIGKSHQLRWNERTHLSEDDEQVRFAAGTSICRPCSDR